MQPAGLIAGVAAALACAASLSASTQFRQFEVRLAPERQALHVLNRAAYGPRPGDVETLRRVGINAWFRQQLEPGKVAESPLLERRLAALSLLDLPTWQLIESIQPPPAQVGMSMANLMRTLPAQTMMLLNSAATSAEQRRTTLQSLSPEVREQALASMPPQLLEGLPDLLQEADRARQKRQETISRLASEQQRRLSPPLPELFTPEQLAILRSGSDRQKSALLDPLDQETRAKVFRSLGPQGARLLPASYRRHALMTSNPQEGVIHAMIEAKLQRAIHSNRQLEEVLVDFWFNHFNVSATRQQVRMLLPSYEREAIRPHVLGRFGDMLLATARHPAMLFYLDNYQSQAPRPELQQALSTGAISANIRLPGINENYARELLELHTLGVDGGYTQEDVVNVARIFTGWTIFDPARTAEFQFNPQFHDRDEKRVLGHLFPRGGGEQEGVQLIALLARHPSTARFISRKLARRFVADEPPPALVERLAATFTRTDGDLRAVMETLLLSREFLSEGAWRAKVKSPLEMVASALRALDADVTDTAGLALRLTDLGQPLYAKTEPTGYTDNSHTWANSLGLLGRMNFAADLLAGEVAGVSANANAVATGDLDRSMRALTGVPAAPEAVGAVEKGGGQARSAAFIATALIGSPEFQRR